MRSDVVAFFSITPSRISPSSELADDIISFVAILRTVESPALCLDKSVSAKAHKQDPKVRRAQPGIYRLLYYASVHNLLLLLLLRFGSVNSESDLKYNICQ